MHRKGHVGMALLAFAPVAYVLVSDGKLALAVLCWLGIQTVEPLPDFDFALSFLNHRGVSHSLFAVVLVGGVLGAVGWFVGGNLFDLLLTALLAGGDLFGWILGRLPDTMANMINLLLPNISLEAVVSHAHEIAGKSVTRRTFAAYGLFVGAYGIFAHLLGDVITDMGIAPFLPLSRWRLSLSPLHADNPVANSSLFFLGVLAIAVVLAATVPGMVLGASAPATLSPVGVASGQDAGPLVAPNGSAEINETRSTRQRIVLESVTLPRNGFIVVQTGTGNVSVNQSSSKTKVVGHTQYVRHGTFRGVVLTLDKPIRGSATVSVSLWNDTNSNQTLDVGSGKADVPYQKNGTPIHDSIRFGANQSQRQNQSQKQNTSNATASVELDSSNNTTAKTVVVSKVRVPKGGFVVVHGPEYAEQGILDGNQITVSRYLKPGTHRNVSIPVKRGVPGAYANSSRINLTRTNLSAIVYRDTNNNTHYDYVGSLGQNDTPYQQGRLPVNDTETVVFEQNVERVRERAQLESLTIQFTDQQVRSADGASVVVIENVTLPKGGFVVVHGERYLPPTRDPLTSAIGHSRYLESGTHRNVSIRLPSGSVTETRTLIAVPYLDTNGDQSYGYVQTGGEVDYQYIARRNGTTVIPNDTARVSPSAPVTTTALSPTTVSSPSFTADTTGTPTTDQPSASSGVLSSTPLWVKSGLLVVVVVVGLTLIGRWT